MYKQSSYIRPAPTPPAAAAAAAAPPAAGDVGRKMVDLFGLSAIINMCIQMFIMFYIFYKIVKSPHVHPYVGHGSGTFAATIIIAATTIPIIVITMTLIATTATTIAITAATTVIPKTRTGETQSASEPRPALRILIYS